MPEGIVSGKRHLLSITQEEYTLVSNQIKKTLFDDFIKEVKQKKEDFQFTSDAINKISDEIDIALYDKSIAVRLYILFAVLDELTETFISICSNDKSKNIDFRLN